MGLKRAVLSASLIAAALPASAAFTLDFEGIADSAFINNFYNGGTDSAGRSGTNYGVQFGSGALGLIDADVAGGSGQFANEPSPNTVMFFLEGSAVLNYAPGFTGGFSFAYSSRGNASVNVYDDLNAKGNIVGTLQLTSQAGDNACKGDPTGQFCNWTVASVTFSGQAKSIDFGGTENQIGYDNMKFGLDTPTVPPVTPPVTPPVVPPVVPPVIPPIVGGPGPITLPGTGGGNGGVVQPIPEPSTSALMLLGLAAIAFAARRRKRRA